MSEVFWISRGEISAPGSSLDLPGSSLEENLRKGGVQPAWLQMVHWVGGHLTSLPGLKNTIVLDWEFQPGLPAYLLHDACRSILMRELNLVLMAEETPAGVDHLVLGSPQAVGAHNLLPRAGLGAWWAVPLVALPSLTIWLEKSGYDTEAVSFLAGDSGLVQSSAPGFTNARILEKQPATTIGQLNALVTALLESRRELGLLISKTSGPTALVTLVER